VDQLRGVQVRRAARDDTRTVIEVIGDAFRDDPVLSWLIPDPERRHDVMARYFRLAVMDLYLPHGQVYLTDDASGAAVCLPPGPPAGVLPTLAELGLAWHFFRACGFRGLLRVNTLHAALRANRPTEPHFYVHALGVRRNQQGRGVGSALLRQVTEICDRRRCPAYLENSNERNLALYERHGFRPVREWHVPGGGPPIWFMARNHRRGEAS